MELREKIVNKVGDILHDHAYYRRGEYEQTVELIQKSQVIADKILALIKEAGYVKLADNQSLPDNPYPRMSQCADEDGAIQTFTNPDWMKFHMAEDAMLKAGFRRVEL